MGEGKVRVRFSHTGGSLRAKSAELRGFELAGEDGAFYPAKASIQKDWVNLSSEQVQEPVYVRYAWHNYCQADLYGESGRPAAPFRTDHFSIEDREG